MLNFLSKDVRSHKKAMVNILPRQRFLQKDFNMNCTLLCQSITKKTETRVSNMTTNFQIQRRRQQTTDDRNMVFYEAALVSLLLRAA